MIHLWYN